MSIEQTLEQMNQRLALIEQSVMWLMQHALRDSQVMSTEQPQPQQVPRSEYEMQHERGDDGSNFYRYRLPSMEWLRIKTDPTNMVEHVIYERSNGQDERLTPEEALSTFPDLPVWSVAVGERGSHPTDPSLNPDVSVPE